MSTKHQHADLSRLKPGSSHKDAKRVSGPMDFGAHTDDIAERTYTSQNTKRSDRGAQQPLSNEEIDGARETGTGGVNSGPGSLGGGDLDVDFVGIAGGTGLAEDIEREHIDGPNDSLGSPDAPNARRLNPASIGALRDTAGSAMLPPDERTIGPYGADAASRQGDGNDDDSFVGEISAAEASGQDDEDDWAHPESSREFEDAV